MNASQLNFFFNSVMKKNYLSTDIKMLFKFKKNYFKSKIFLNFKVTIDGMKYT